MPAAWSALPLSLVFLFALPSVWAQSEARPSIFAPRVEPMAVAPSPTPPSSPTSDRMRGVLMQRALADIAALGTPAPSTSASMVPDQPVVGQKAAEKKEPGDAAVKMAPFVVVESRRMRDLSEQLESESQKKKHEQFSFIKGGTIYKIGLLEIGAWGDRSGLTFLKITW